MNPKKKENPRNREEKRHGKNWKNPKKQWEKHFFK